MGKDKHGTYIPKKGKPSGAGKSEGLGFRPTMPPEDVEQDLEMTDKYIKAPDELADNVYMRHPNRNTEKEYDKQDKDENPSAKSIINTVDKEHHPATNVEELPNVLDKSIFNDLASYKADICISVYIPTHKKGEAVNNHQDLIRFKNAVQQAKQMLEEKGTDETTVQRILQPAYDFVRNEDFWMEQNKGFVAFIADGYFKYAKLPVAVDEEVYINNSFLLSPLVPSLYSDERFYLLVLSKKNAKIYKGDAFGMEELDVPELPNGVTDVVHFEEKDDQNLFRTGGRGGTGGANFHGIGGGEPDEKKHLTMYFDEVDETLMKHVLATENAPLLLAAVDYLIPLYKSVAKYNFIADEAITGNYEHEDVNTLFKMAKEKLQSYFKQHVQKELNNYYNNSATNLTSTDANEIIPGAYYARVAHLFVQKGVSMWGSFDKDNNTLQLHSNRQDKDENLLDKAVVKTILNGGEVHMLNKEEMPDGAAIAAFFRY